MNDSDAVLRCEAVVKNYEEGPQCVEVLKGIDFCVRKGERVAVVGASGSGKSTLLNILGGLDSLTSGSVYLGGNLFSSLDENARGLIRNKTMGFVYQFHHLLPEFSAQENVAMPLFISGKNKTAALEQAADGLRDVGLDTRLDHKPSELSGGERQRVAIARALINNPSCVLMDEPTGNLDKTNAESIQALMLSLSEKSATSFIVVTHDEQLAQSMDRIFELLDGQLVERSS